MSTTTRLITADELLVMPHRDERGNDCRLELIRGQVSLKEIFSPAHGILCAEMGFELGAFVEAHDLGLVATGSEPPAVAGGPL